MMSIELAQEGIRAAWNEERLTPSLLEGYVIGVEPDDQRALIEWIDLQSIEANAEEDEPLTFSS